MDIQNLIKMANQIGQFFDTYPDHAAAVANVAEHITRFWEPRMRAALIEHVHAHGESCGLAPVVREAVTRLGPPLTIEI
ncbi:formate dehydrogenase subunit delta [Nitrogeniibacter aestuarii]|uniref:formate dehydrogenase subunit delta n=1 Tax=Nitrogeniibacter aestuarii TaxID=2815343 RepID=UPI001D10D21E|nr:formate dehydrogenase subunit delta [Nitrogeniibacter aestuarii]